MRESSDTRPMMEQNGDTGSSGYRKGYYPGGGGGVLSSVSAAARRRPALTAVVAVLAVSAVVTGAVLAVKYAGPAEQGVTVAGAQALTSGGGGENCSALAARLDVLDRKTSDMSDDVTRLTLDVRRNNSTVKYLANAHRAVQDKITKISITADDLKTQTAQLQTQMTSARDDVSKMAEKLATAPGAGTSGASVIFSAAASETMSYNNGDVVQFKHVFTNIGNSYDSSSSKFVCPRTGIYLFSVVLHEGYNADHRYKGIGELYVDDKKIFRVFAYDDTRADTSSNLAAVPCRAGHEAYVRATETYMIYDSASHFNTFTGVLLREGGDQ